MVEHLKIVLNALTLITLSVLWNIWDIDVVFCGLSAKLGYTY